MTPAEISRDTVIIENRVLPDTQSGLDDAMQFSTELDERGIPVLVTRDSEIIVWILWTLEEALQVYRDVDRVLELTLSCYPELSSQRDLTRAAIMGQDSVLDRPGFRQAS